MRILEALKRDYVRHSSTLKEPGVWTLLNYRVGRVLKALPGPVRPLGDAVHRLGSLAVELACGTLVSRDVELGEATHFVHALNLRIAPGVKLGDRVGIMQEVTIGPARGKEGLPVIGNDVFIGVGATILGPVKIGDGAVIGARSLVIDDVPAGAAVIGVPAKRMGWPALSTTEPKKAKPD